MTPYRWNRCHTPSSTFAHAPALPQQPPLDDLTDSELIDRAKTAKFPAAKKWGRARKLGSGERSRAIAYLDFLAAI